MQEVLELKVCWKGGFIAKEKRRVQKVVCISGGLLSHRIVWEMLNGPIPSGMNVDHIDGDPRNSRIENLRLCTQSQNLANSKLSNKSKTGHKGVFYDPKNKKYRAALKVRGVNVLAKRYRTLEEAVAARNEAARAHQGEFFRTK
jgi:hypothetical protein